MTDEDKEKMAKNRKVWEEHINLVEQIIKHISTSKGDCHKKQDNIRAIAHKLLSDKKQIEAFMAYEKTKKIDTVKNYQKEVRKKVTNAVQQSMKENSTKQLNKQQRLALEKKIIEKTQIICTTLAMSTNEKLECLNSDDIEYLIVDEAC